MVVGEKGMCEMNVVVLIPTLNPTEKLLTAVDNLINEGFGEIVVVDDGSRDECARIFERLDSMPQCVVVHHEVNRGKGRALKTGFDYVLRHKPDCLGVVTTDDDGQHSPRDIMSCAKKMLQTGNAVLGARDFSLENVPPKSRFGNSVTRFVFRFLCGIKITDTQTGLRAIPREMLPAMCEISGERFEYETNMLLEMKQLSFEFEEVKIETIYCDNNSATHFSPLKDSVRIYAVILKFMVSSVACSVIDIALFTFVNVLCAPLFGTNESLRILTATAAARIVSSLTNFLLNKKRVFRSAANIKQAAVRYYILAAAQLAASTLCVSVLSALFGTAADFRQTLIKLVVDTALFFVSFGIQRDWVYADKGGKNDAD